MQKCNFLKLQNRVLWLFRLNAGNLKILQMYHHFLDNSVKHNWQLPFTWKSNCLQLNSQPTREPLVTSIYVYNLKSFQESYYFIHEICWQIIRLGWRCGSDFPLCSGQCCTWEPFLCSNLASSSFAGFSCVFLFMTLVWRYASLLFSLSLSFFSFEENIPWFEYSRLIRKRTPYSFIFIKWFNH